MFKLHSALAKDCTEISKLSLCRVLLMDDKNYPWVILVPEINGLRDLDDLDVTSRGLVMADLDRVCKTLKALYKPYKINVAALGNKVEQLHIHVIARFQDDPSWPDPVWGAASPVDYTDEECTKTCDKINHHLNSQKLNI